MTGNTDDTDRAGVALCSYAITRTVGIFREQTTSDYGVDAQVEFKHNGRPTGRLVGLQIKSGQSYFGEPIASGDGWRFRPKPEHITYWLGHSLPMFLVLVDLDEETIYWQALTVRTLTQGPQGGVFVVIPRIQTLSTAGAAWEASANSFADSALVQYDDNLTRVSPQTAKLLRTFADTDSNTAALLAARFARGRGTPELVVRSLLESEPPWVSPAAAGEGLDVIAEYAHSHGLISLAADTLVRAADRDSSQALRRYRVAGLLLMDDDRQRAQELLRIAQDLPAGEDDVNLAIGLAVADHPEGHAGRVGLPADLEARISHMDDNDFVVSFRATRAQRSGELNEAVRLFELAQSLAPDAPGLMLALAESLARRSRTPDGKPRDRELAVTWASRAVDQLHEWSGPTEGALTTLLQSLMSSGQFSAALDRCLTSPDGRALPDEARRPAVQATAVIAAHALDRLELSNKIIGEMPEGLERDMVMARTSRDMDSGEQRTAWLSILARLDESRPEALVQAVLRLSELGVDEADRLSNMVERHMVSPVLQELASLTASAAENLDAVLPRLRILAETDEPSALQLVNLLLDARRYDDAEVAASDAYTRFGAVEFVLYRVDALSRLDRSAEVEALLGDALADTTLDPYNRRQANRTLARVLARRAVEADEPERTELWQGVERHLSACVDQDVTPVVDGDVWFLADAQMRLGNVAQAYATLVSHDPEISANCEARLWLAIAQQQPSLPTNDYRRMLDLAAEFDDDPELSGALLGFVALRTRDAEDEPATPADHRPVLDGELRTSAFAALQAHAERYGEQSPIRVLHAETSEGLVAQMTDVMRRDHEPVIQAVELARQARAPMGLLSLLAHRPYASTIAERPLGYHLAAAALQDDDVADEEAAAVARGGDVVVDASALLVANELGEYDNFRGSYRRVLMPAVSHVDIVRGRSEIDGRSSSAGFVVYDPTIDSLVASEVDVAEHLATLGRFERMEQAATSPLQVPHVPIESLGQIAMPGSEPWLAPIALAKERGIPLWSDDLAQRRLARLFGVHSFGTTTLQQLRTQAQIEDVSTVAAELDQLVARRRDEVLNLLANRVVDVATDSATVIEAARAEAWREPVALVTVGRPGWWHMGANPFADLQLILATADGDRAAHDVWRYHAMWGVLRVAAEEPSRQATLLAAVAMLPLDVIPDVDATLRHLTVAIQIAAAGKAHKPTDSLYEAAAMLLNAGVLRFPTTLVEQIRDRIANGYGDAPLEDEA